MIDVTGGSALNDIIFTLLIGLGLGALYAMLGAGLVVSYKGSGVINFAYGAMAMYGLFTFDTAWNRGQFYLPWVDFLPTQGPEHPRQDHALRQRHLADDGCARPRAPDGGRTRARCPLPRLPTAAQRRAARQGRRLVGAGALPPRRRPHQLRQLVPAAASVVPDEAIENFLGLGKVFPRNTIYVVGFALLAGLIVWAGYRYTRFGLATRAAAGNEKGAVLLGYSPQRLAAINWVIASVLATLAVIVVGPIAGTITPVGLTALIVPASGCGADRWSAVDPDRGGRRPRARRRADAARRPSRPTGSTAASNGCRPASATSCRSS